MQTANYTYLKFIALLALLGVVIALAGCQGATPPAGEKTVSGGLASAPAAGGCYNAYYPASATLKKSYKSTYAGNNFPPSTFSESFINFTSNGFTHKMEFAPYELKSKTGQVQGSSNGIVVESGIKCKAEGLMALESGNLNAGQNVQYKYKTVKAEGVSFPKESDWQVGKKWDLLYEVEGEFTKTPVSNMMAPKGSITISSEIVGKESVTVAAGTFDAFKVAMTMSNKLTMKMAGKDLPMNTTIKSTTWFARDVGMVKAVAEVGGAITELVTVTK